MHIPVTRRSRLMVMSVRAGRAGVGILLAHLELLAFDRVLLLHVVGLVADHASRLRLHGRNVLRHTVRFELRVENVHAA